MRKVVLADDVAEKRQTASLANSPAPGRPLSANPENHIQSMSAFNGYQVQPCTHLCSLSFVARLSNGRNWVLVLVLLRLRSSGKRGSVYSLTNSAASQWPYRSRLQTTDRATGAPEHTSTMKRQCSCIGTAGQPCLVQVVPPDDNAERG